MPTVTVLAWCLIASMGRASSSIPRVSAVASSSTVAPGVPTRPKSSVKNSSGSARIA